MLRFARDPSRATSSGSGSCTRGQSHKTGLCAHKSEMRVASCTCNFNAHVEQPFESFVFVSFLFFCGSQIKNVNKQAAGTSWLGGGVG